MRIVLDLQTLQSQSRHRGIGSYSRGLAGALLAQQEGHEWHVLLNAALSGGDPLLKDPELASWLEDRVPARNIHIFSGLYGTQGMSDGFIPRENASSLLREHLLSAIKPDLVHVASPFEGFGDETIVEADDLDRTRANAGAGADSGWYRAATLYDLIPFDMPDPYLKDPQTRRFFEKRRRQLDANHTLLAISEYVAERAAKTLAGPLPRIVAIGADVDPIFTPTPLDPVNKAGLLARYGISRPFFLHVGILEYRKNVGFLAEAFARLPKEIRAETQIVLVAKNNAFHREQCIEWRARYHLSEDELVLAGEANQRDLVGLYQSALAAIMPSMAEGFGLPILEAMRCGTPGFGARATSLPEVVGNDAYLFSLSAPDELSALLSKMAIEPDFKAAARRHAEEQAKVFSWARSARLALEAFEEVVKQDRKSGDASLVAFTRAKTLSPPVLSVDAVLTSVILDKMNEQPSVLAITRAGPLEIAHELATLLAYRQAGYGGVPDKAGAIFIPDPAGLDANALLALHPNLLGLIAPQSEGSWEWVHRVSGDDAFQGLLRGEAKTRPAAEADLLRSLATTDLSEDLFRIERLALAAKGLAPGEIGHLARSLVLDRAKDPGMAQRRQRRLFVDVSHLAHYDAKSGIQRVVRNILTGLFALDLPYRIEPVFRQGDDVFFARGFSARFLKKPALPLREDLVDFRPDDIFFGLDLDADIPPSAIAKMEELKRIGVTFVIVVYDILPLRHPEWFDPGMSAAFRGWLEFLSRCADTLVCISQATADDVRLALAQSGCPRLDSIRIEPFPLGADILSDPNAVEAQGRMDNFAEKLGVQHYLLTVGTIEPRKGHDHLLDAIEAFLATRKDTGFVIVGKRGWLVDGLIERLQALMAKHPQICWIEGANDQELASLYQQARAVLVPSRAEGFGLPLIEAEHAGLPVLARDIPVFREIGSSQTRYFQGEDGATLASEIAVFLDGLNASSVHPADSARLWLWSESAAALAMQIEKSLAKTPHPPGKPGGMLSGLKG